MTGQVFPTKKVAFALLSLGILGLSAWMFRAKRLRATRQAQAAQARSELRRCWLGPPLAKGETWAQRWRRLELAREQVKRPHANCSRYGSALVALLATDHPVHSRRLKKALTCEPSCRLPDRLASAQKALAMLEALPLPNHGANNPLAALAPRLPSAERFAALTAAGFRLHDRQRRADGRQLLLWVGPLGRIQICTLGSQGGPACQGHRLQLDAKLRQHERPRWRLHRGGDAILLVDMHGKVRDLRGKELRHVGGVAEGVIVQRQSGGYALGRVAAGKILAKAWLPTEELASRPVAAGNDVVYSQSAEAGDKLVWQRLRAYAPLLSEPQVLGPAQKGRPRLCQSGGSAVLVWGGAQPSALAFRDGNGRWQPLLLLGTDKKAAAAKTKGAKSSPKKDTSPVRKKIRQDAKGFGMAGLLGSDAADVAASPWDALPTPTPKDRAAPANNAGAEAQKSTRRLRFFLRPKRPFVPRLRPFSMQCKEGKFSYTWSNGKELRRWICTPHGCQRQSISLGFFNPKTIWTAASLGFDARAPLALVWEAQSGAMLAKVSVPAKWAENRVMWLFDEPAHGGPHTRDAQVLVGAQGLTLLFRSRGLHGLQIDARGAIRRFGSEPSDPGPRPSAAAGLSSPAPSSPPP